MNQYKVANRVLAAVAFLVALLTYASTLQPSVPFWDCGEFSAATTWQQVPHPPGAPLWLITARLFQIFSFGDLGWRVNLAAGICSAFTAMLVYLIGVRLVERWHPFREGRSLMSYLPTFGGSLIAALAFTWSDSQWFNSVESEVYAGGTTLIALLVYLMMRWDQEAERPRHERYLLLMAYLLGLAIGVHLLALLVVPAIAMVIYFKRYRFTPVSFLVLMGVTGISFYFFIYQAPLKYIPQLLATNALAGIVVFAVLLGGLWWSVKNKQPLVFLPIASFLLIVLGYTTYTHVLLRANAHPAMNENEPDTFGELVAYLGREQYGNAPTWPRRYQSEAYYRQYQDRYDSGTGGNWTPPTGQNPDGSLIFDHINTSGELNFMWSYQISTMYLRYFFWNFVGRVSDVQGSGTVLSNVTDREKKAFIEPTGYDKYFPIRFFALPLLLGLFGLYWHYRRDWKMAFVFTALFLFMGVLAALQQNQQEPQPRERDYFYTGSFMIFCSWIGLGAVGLAEVLRRRKTGESEETGVDEPQEGGVGMTGGVLALCLVAVPINMAVGGWKLHDRSGNWIPWDYSYNILQSCDKDAVLFTNGDNDTFPLWYLQDVAGIRRDVRVVNLSLGQMGWYIWQLKHERPWGALPVPISIDDNQLRVPDGAPIEQQGLRPELGQATQVSVDVPADVMSWATNGANKAPGKMTWTLHGQPYGDNQELFTVYHKLIRNIIETNKWKRPIYFSSTVGPDAWAGLDEYFRWEGMAYRVMPIKLQSNIGMEPIDPTIMMKCLMTPLRDDEFYPTPHYGFKFRNLTNPNVFFLEDHRRIPNGHYRSMYLAMATYALQEMHNPQQAVAVLNRLEQVVSPDMFAMPYWISARIAEIYSQAGVEAKAQDYARRTIAAIDALGEEAMNDQAARAYPPPLIRLQMLALSGNYDEAISQLQQFRLQYPNEPSLRRQEEELRVRKFLSKKDTAGAMAEAQRLIVGYGGDTAQSARVNIAALRDLVSRLAGRQIAPPDNTTATPTPDSAASQSTKAPSGGR